MPKGEGSPFGDTAKMEFDKDSACMLKNKASL